MFAYERDAETYRARRMEEAQKERVYKQFRAGSESKVAIFSRIFKRKAASKEDTSQIPVGDLLPSSR
jgi:hypothetical protein